MTEAVRKIIGQNIKKCRTRLHMRQERLAELLNVSAHTISRFETGKSSCTLETVLALSDALEVSPNALLEGAFQANPQQQYEDFLSSLEDTLMDSISYEVNCTISQVMHKSDTPEHSSPYSYEEHTRVAESPLPEDT